MDKAIYLELYKELPNGFRKACLLCYDQAEAGERTEAESRREYLLTLHPEHPERRFYTDNGITI